MWRGRTQIVLFGKQILVHNLVCRVFIKKWPWEQHLLREEGNMWGQREKLNWNANPMPASADPRRTLELAHIRPDFWAFYTPTWISPWIPLLQKGLPCREQMKWREAMCRGLKAKDTPPTVLRAVARSINSYFEGNQDTKIWIIK